MKAERILFKVVTDPRRFKNNETIPLKLRITYKGERKYYATSFSVTNEDWEIINSASAKGKLKIIKNEITIIEIEAEKIGLKIIPFSFSQFESKFFKKSHSNKKYINDMYQIRISNLKTNNQFGTASIYNDTLTSLSKFRNNLVLNDISVSFLQEYERWMLQQNKSKTTIGMYIRSLRAIMNIAIEDGLIDKEQYPFGKRKYVIPTGQNIKKALNLPNIKRIFEYPVLENSNIEMAKDFWIFSYLCNGINMMDIAHLKWGNLSSQTITFERRKTRNTNKADAPIIVANRSDKINYVLKKWASEKKTSDDFVFKIIDKNDNPENARKKIQQFTKLVNKWTKKIGADLGLELKLTTYVARHSFATILVQNGAPLEFASQSLGHTNISTTQKYFAGFDLDAQKEYTKALTNF